MRREHRGALHRSDRARRVHRRVGARSSQAHGLPARRASSEPRRCGPSGGGRGGVDERGRTRTASQVWIANTDGDSAVPPSGSPCRSPRAGGVRMSSSARFGRTSRICDPRHQRHWHATHTPGRAERTCARREPGRAWPAATSRRAVSKQAPSTRTYRSSIGAGASAPWSSRATTAEVLTSGRTVGRTPGGYAGYLREQALAIDVD